MCQKTNQLTYNILTVARIAALYKRKIIVLYIDKSKFNSKLNAQTILSSEAMAVVTCNTSYGLQGFW